MLEAQAKEEKRIASFSQETLLDTTQEQQKAQG